MENVEIIIAQLKEHLASLGDPKDCRSDNEITTYWQNYNRCQKLISAIIDGPDQVAKHQAFVDPLELLRSELVDFYARLETEICNFPDPMKIVDAKERDKEFYRQAHLQRQHELLEAGQLIRNADGACWPTFGDLDAEINYYKSRRDRAQDALDFQLQQAKKLLKEKEKVSA